MLNLADIQGNILRGYRSFKKARLLYFGLLAPSQAREGITRILPLITPADWEDRPEAAVNVALSFAGLRQLGLPASSLASFPSEFQAGMAARAASLGDVRDSRPELWEDPWKDGKVHLLAIVYAVTDDRVDCMAKAVQEKLGDGATLLRQQDCAVLPNQHEHFGFRDGLSNPQVAGAPTHEDSHRSSRKDRQGRSIPIAAGEFILGQPKEGGDVGILPTPHMLIRNGTFLVVRKLAQNVGAFRDFIEKQTDALAAVKPPPNTKLHKDFVAAKMMGRWPDGTPLAVSPHSPSGAEHPTSDFSYARDSEGAYCPLGAHIRRTNPRDGLGFDGKLVDRHRLIRRGIPYGAEWQDDDQDDNSRGLMFLAFNASIADQFEFVQQQWIEFGDTFGQGNDKDPVLGNHDGTGKMIIPGDARSNRAPFICAGLPCFVTVRGGEYFFVPSLTALNLIAANQVNTSS
jgi:Dyp-type peroxidase family